MTLQSETPRECFYVGYGLPNGNVQLHEIYVDSEQRGGILTAGRSVGRSLRQLGSLRIGVLQPETYPSYRKALAEAESLNDLAPHETRKWQVYRMSLEVFEPVSPTTP